MATKTLMLEFDSEMVSAESDADLTVREIVSGMSLLMQLLLRDSGMGFEEIEEVIRADISTHKIHKVQ